MIDERARRRPDFDGPSSAWIILSDGGCWAFPKPWLEIQATFRDGWAVATRPRLTYGPELDELVRVIDACTDNAALLVGAASLGAYLLRCNYDLPDDELDQLFAIRVGEPSSWDWARGVIGLATGTSGSRSFRGGSGSP